MSFMGIKRSSVFGILVLLVAAAAPLTRADAASQAARDLYKQGQFADAVALAVQDDPAHVDFAFAAQALLSRIYYKQEINPRSEPERLQDLEQARLYAAEAIKRRPDDVSGYLQMLIALGHEGQNKGALWVIFTGLISDTRDLLEKAAELAPDSAWRHGLLGGWHLELLRKGGATFAKDNGASFEAGMQAYHKALQIDPANPFLRTEYALGLLMLDADAHRAEVLKTLLPLRDYRPVDFAETLATNRGLRALAFLEAGDQQGLDAMLDQVDRWRSVE